LNKDGVLISPEMMDEYCQEKGFDKWFETSAKENINIDTSIRYLINEVRFYFDINISLLIFVRL
jgi:hypothetical protein